MIDAVNKMAQEVDTGPFVFDELPAKKVGAIRQIISKAVGQKGQNDVKEVCYQSIIL